jgi:hypothetical protein
MKVLSVFLLVVSQISLAEQSLEPDYSSGYCVRIEDEMKKENAIVIVEKGHLNGAMHRLQQGTGDFFNFKNGISKLSFLDWGGTAELVKLADKFNSQNNIALFRNYTHGGFVDPTIVICSIMEQSEKGNE